MQPNPNRLNDEIRRGLSRLVCLCLDSAPAVDLVEGTAQAWLTALTRGRAWDEQREAQRVRAAFDTLLANAQRWPIPHDLLAAMPEARRQRSEAHTSELQSLMRRSYAGHCLKKKNIKTQRER